MQGRLRTKLLTRLLAAAAMVAVYFAGILLPASVMTSTTAEAYRGRGRGGGRGRGRGFSRGRGRGFSRGRGRGFSRGRGRGRGFLFFYPGWGSGLWYRCMRRHGC
jgi:hypothetical protein